MSECKHVVVAPITSDVDVALLEPLVSESEFFDHSQAGNIFGSNVDFYSVQIQAVEKVVASQRHSRWRDASAGHFGNDPVTNHGARHRTKKNIGYIELPNHFAINLDDERQPREIINLARKPAHHATNVEAVGC